MTDSRTRDLAVEIRGAVHGDVDALQTQVPALRGGILTEETSLRWLDEELIAPGGHR